MLQRNAVRLSSDMPFIVTEHNFLLQGALMVSTPGKSPRFLRPMPGLSCRFDPVATMDSSDDTGSTELLEFVLLADSPQLPAPHFRSDDGNFHTGDLFEKQSDGSYLFRGRNDDWIKTEGATRVDTKFVYPNLFVSQSLKDFPAGL